MQALSQSSFLQALGYAIANSLWQVALLWLVALVINACFKLSSHSRYRVAITAQLAGFVWFVVTLQFYYRQCIKATADANLFLQNNTIVYQPGMIDSRYDILTYIAKAEMLLPYLSLAYLCLLCVLAVRWMKSYRYTNRLKHDGLQKADMDWRLFVQNMAAQLGIKQDVKMYISTLVTTPLTIGFLKPLILVPVATINHLTTQQLEAVLLHELAHIKRADYVINLLLNIIETILFFNPFTRLISKSINKEREHCCDDWVLQFQYNAPMYAEALLRIACLQASPSMVMKAEGKGEGELLWRVKRLLNHKQKRFNYSQQMIALVVTTCLLISIAWLQPAGSAQQQAAVKPLKAVMVAPMTAQVTNPLFNPLAFLAKPLNEEVKQATQDIVKAGISKVINRSLGEAGKALNAVAPSVLDELSKLSVDSNFQQAATTAQEELKKVDWSSLQQLSPFADSAFVTNAVKLAMDKRKMYADFEKAKQSLKVSKQELARLKHQNFAFLLNQAHLQAAIDNAASWLNSDNLFINQETENTGSAKRSKEAKERQQQLFNRRLLESANQPRMHAYKDYAPRGNDAYAPDTSLQTFGYSFSNPVYVETVPDTINEDSVYSYTVQSLPPVPAPPPAAKPSVRLIKVADKHTHLNIIIEINQ